MKVAELSQADQRTLLRGGELTRRLAAIAKLQNEALDKVLASIKYVRSGEDLKDIEKHVEVTLRDCDAIAKVGE